MAQQNEDKPQKMSEKIDAHGNDLMWQLIDILVDIVAHVNGVHRNSLALVGEILEKLERCPIGSAVCPF